MAEAAHDRPWRLALIVDDADAVRVLCAWYSQPRRLRMNLARLGALANIDAGVADIIARLEAAGLINQANDTDAPPPVAVNLMNVFVTTNLSPSPRRGR